MKSRVCYLVFIVASLTALAVAVSSRLSRERTANSLPRGLLISPGIDVAAEEEQYEGKHRITREVIGDRISLTAAAAEFRRLDGLLPLSVRLVHNFHGAASEEEAYCRAVIAWVESEQSAECANATASKLRLELDVMLRDGTMHLPTDGNVEPPRSTSSRG